MNIQYILTIELRPTFSKESNFVLKICKYSTVICFLIKFIVSLNGRTIAKKNSKKGLASD